MLMPYDTLLRPLQTVVNAVQDGNTDNDGIMDDFSKGVLTAMSGICTTIYIRIYLDRSCS